jgi:ATP-binding cassette subfamily C (CFTR/MRP) protein 1
MIDRHPFHLLCRTRTGVPTCPAPPHHRNLNGRHLSVVVIVMSASANMEPKSSAHPIADSYFVTRFLVLWIAPLIQLARKRQLKDSDVWECPPQYNVLHSHEKFQTAWKHELELSVRESRDPALLKAILRCFRADFLLSGAMQLLFVAFQIGQPFLVGQLVRHVRTGNGGMSFGVGLAIALGVISVGSSISVTIVFYITRIIGMEVKAAMMMAVYEKALCLTSAAKQENTVGQTTNLAAIDAEKIFLAAQFPHFLW